MEKERARTVIDGAQDAFGLAVLLAGVRVGQPEDSVVGSKKLTRGMAVELAAVVSLDREHRQLKLRSGIGIEIAQNGKDVRLVLEGKRPNVASVIIKNY